MQNLLKASFGLLAMAAFVLPAYADDAPATADAPPAKTETKKKEKKVKKAEEKSAKKGTTVTDIAPGIKGEDLVVGKGTTATKGAMATVHYTGWLTNGTEFDSSKKHGSPFEFPLGGGRVIKGWDLGVVGMKVGGKRKLTIQPEMGYGSQGAPPVIPPNSTLVFEVELLAVK